VVSVVSVVSWLSEKKWFGDCGKMKTRGDVSPFIVIVEMAPGAQCNPDRKTPTFLGHSNTVSLLT
jgi:hypothetical protein